GLRPRANCRLEPRTIRQIRQRNADMTLALKTQENFNRELLKFIDESPTPFHAVARMRIMLEAAGFKALDPAVDWRTMSAAELDRSYVVRNTSSIVILANMAALAEPEGIGRGLRIYGA